MELKQVSQNGYYFLFLFLFFLTFTVLFVWKMSVAAHQFEFTSREQLRCADWKVENGGFVCRDRAWQDGITEAR